jgi:hypothetical protein
MYTIFTLIAMQVHSIPELGKPHHANSPWIPEWLSLVVIAMILYVVFRVWMAVRKDKQH